MKMRQGFFPAYNAQAMVSPVETGQETSGMLVTAVELVDEPSDYARLVPVLRRAEEMTGVKAPLTLADAGYHSAVALEECADRGQQAVVPESSRGRALDHLCHKDRFTCDPDSDTHRCPQGEALHLVRSKFAGGTSKRMYQAPKSICQACPVVAACITSGSRSRGLVLNPMTLPCAVIVPGWPQTRPVRRSRGESNWSNPSSGSSNSNRGYEGSCRVVLATSPPNGPCWPPPSTCGLCGVYGVPGGRFTRISSSKPCPSNGRQHDS